MNIKVIVKHGKLRIYFNTILNLSIQIKHLTAIQAYENKGYFFIHYSSKTLSLKSKYHNKHHWTAILRQLDNIIEI